MAINTYLLLSLHRDFAEGGGDHVALEPDRVAAATVDVADEHCVHTHTRGGRGGRAVSSVAHHSRAVCRRELMSGMATHRRELINGMAHARAACRRHSSVACGVCGRPCGRGGVRTVDIVARALLGESDDLVEGGARGEEAHEPPECGAPH